jgi:subtilisin family serine protease
MKEGIKVTGIAAGLTMLIGSTIASPVAAADRVSMRTAAVPASINEMRLSEPLTAHADRTMIDPALQQAGGSQQVLVRLRTPSVAKHVKQSNGNGSAHKQRLISEQSAFVNRASKVAPGAKKLADVQVVLNAVVMEVDAAAIGELAKDPDVYRISRVKDYELDLAETVPYIGALTAPASGFDGSGVSVAVLDSGIDYYHAALGGTGNPADYAADDPTIIEPGTFPTADVVGGFDFTGSDWPAGPVLFDPDPIDDGPAAGHGTHVADIIGGNGGVAPGVDLYAVKVCSSISSSCSGIALIAGMEFSVDPNGDGDTSDAIDIINMSLGSTAGQPFDDDLSQAVENASAAGVLTVSSAGNCGDKPYCTGTPSSAPSALSVAQTQVPSAALQLITVDGADYPAVFQPWSVPLAGPISGAVQYGNGAGGNLNGCAPFAPGSLAGLIVLVDRGACNFTLKISNISQAGGAAGIIGLVAPGAPFSGGDGGDRPIDIPGYMINQADSFAIKAQIGGPGIGTIDAANQLPLAGQMVGSSARGPQHEAENRLKPEIGAPGASVSANAGTGTGTGPFGGTSGASPMVAGAAALLLEAQPGLTPAESKAKLMNTGETNIDIDPFSGLAEITRIGGGEVRVDRAVGAPAAAWDEDTLQGGLSFGYVEAARETQTLNKKVRVRNYSDHAITYSITPTFRFAGDAASGAVSVDAPQKVKVRANSDQLFNVRMTINGLNLPGNFMNSGSQGANPAALTANEYDGYLQLEGSDGSSLHLPWHVLPRQSASVVGRSVLTFDGGVDNVLLTNNGVGTAQIDAYSLLAVSPNQPEGGAGQQAPMPDIRAVGVNTIPVPALFCSAQPSFIWVFAINTWERQEHLLPVSHQVWLDTDQDGASDYVVLNRDLTFSGIGDGRQVTWAFNLSTGATSAFFFAEHATNTGNTVMLICGEQVGLTGTDMLATNVDAFVVAQDWYYGGPGDFVGDLTITPLGERYFGIPSDIPASGAATTTVLDFGPFPGNTDELGVMLITNGDRGTGARGGATQATEALLITTK